MVSALFVRFVFGRQRTICFQSCPILQGRKQIMHPPIPTHRGWELIWGLNSVAPKAFLSLPEGSPWGQVESVGFIAGTEYHMCTMVWTVSAWGPWCDTDSLCHAPQIYTLASSHSDQYLYFSHFNTQLSC